MGINSGVSTARDLADDCSGKMDLGNEMSRGHSGDLDGLLWSLTTGVGLL